jgi:twitching motility protein PilJ
MSVSDLFKNLFAKKAPEMDPESRLSLAMPYEDGMDGDAQETMAVEAQPERVAVAPSKAKPSAAEASPLDSTSEGVTLPFLGKRPPQQQQRILGIALAVSLLVPAGATVYSLNQAGKTVQQMGAVGQALTQAQRLAHAATQALAGNTSAIAAVGQSAEALGRQVQALRSGDSDLGVAALDAGALATLEAVAPLLERTQKNAVALLQAQKPLQQVGAGLQQMRTQQAQLALAAQALASLTLQQGAPAADVAASGQLLMLTQRMGKLANELLLTEAMTPDAPALLQKDLVAFRDLSQSLLSAAADDATRQALQALAQPYEALTTQGTSVLGNLGALAAARQAQRSLEADSEPLRQGLELLQARVAGGEGGMGLGMLLVLVLAAIVALLSALGLYAVQAQDSRRRQAAADAQRLQAQQQEQEAKRFNDATQAAILRLMNELQAVAEGDLTQEATVTEDITGAIADSVNYTVEELRSLVGNVQKTAAQVAQTTSDVDTTSTELLAASKEQLHEIHATGQSVVEMAGRINDMSAQAQESARVSRLSLQAAESGLQAVQNTIGGMNAIRDQIQDTSKRIKRLGESSQEIGEITELISDITEQTNVLALNAAIQAASAGEAGRGFSVVAEEVQRLAERSADATRQIAALVKAIQTDTQDAIGAMERSTQGVVEGAKLSDNAGTALSEIDRVSRRVADLIEQISGAAAREAGLANEVAENIQHIFAVTEQTGEGTRVTAGQVRELSRMAEELRQSVSRFKIA